MSLISAADKCDNVHNKSEQMDEGGTPVRWRAATAEGVMGSQKGNDWKGGG